MDDDEYFDPVNEDGEDSSLEVTSECPDTEEVDCPSDEDLAFAAASTRIGSRRWTSPSSSVR